jgi:hypothetical protein
LRTAKSDAAKLQTLKAESMRTIATLDSSVSGVKPVIKKCSRGVGISGAICRDEQQD